MRSLLFVPGDSEKKLVKAIETEADCLLVDLEDSVVPDAKPAARDMTTAYLKEHMAREVRPELYVRINSLDTRFWEDDLAVVMAGRPEGLLMPKAANGEEVAQLSIALDLAESRVGLTPGTTKLIVLTTEVPMAILHMQSFIGASQRLQALTWGAEDLSAVLGSSTNRQPDGNWTSPYRLARDLCLITAAAGDVAAIDTVFTNYRDQDGLAREAQEAARDGFAGKMAIHPAQVPVINEAFTPSTEDVARAEGIVAAFAEQGDVGVVGLGNEMLDRPHLRRAERVLERARLGEASRSRS
ncbi:MAG: CoA ester lyase [Hyphomicrobiaceae bacterium]